MESYTETIEKLRDWRQYHSWMRQVYRISSSLDHLTYCNPLVESEEMDDLPVAPVWGNLDYGDPNFSAAWNVFQYRKNEYKQIRKAEAKLLSLIHASLANHLKERLLETDLTSKQVILRVKEMVKPEKHLMRETSEQAYANLRETPIPVGDISRTKAWIQKWFRVEKDLQDSQSVLVNQIPVDFLSRTRAIDSHWQMLRQHLVDGGTVSNTLHSHASALELHLERDNIKYKTTSLNDPKMALTTKTPASMPAGAASQPARASTPNANQNTNQKQQDEDANKKKRPCICGEQHSFYKCPYVVAEHQPVNWKADPDIVQKFNKVEEKNPNVRKLLKRIRKKAEQSEKSDSEEQTGNNNFSLGIIGDISLHLVHDGQKPGNHLQNAVIIDTGSGVHITNDRTRFQTFKEMIIPIQTAAGGITNAQGIGTMKVKPDLVDESFQKEWPVQETLYIPESPTTLISHAKAKEKGLSFDFDALTITYQGKFIASFKQVGYHYVLQNDHSSRVVNHDSSLAVAQPPNLWHERLGHINHMSLSKLSERVDGLPKTYDRPDLCEACRISKAKQQISRTPQQRAKYPFEKLHVDFTQMEVGIGKNEWCLHATDDFSRMHIVSTLLKRKGALKLLFCDSLIPYIRTQFHEGRDQVKTIRIDNESSITNEFRTWCAERGIILEFSAPYTPQQNGVAERAGGVLTTMARTLIQHGKVPEFLWPEAIRTAAFIINRTTIIQGKTPFEHVWNTRPNVSYLRPFGCKAFVLKKPPPPKAQKVSPRAFVGYLMGYDSAHIFRIWQPLPNSQYGRIVRSRDVTFDESKFFDLVEASEIDLDAVQEEVSLTSDTLRVVINVPDEVDVPYYLPILAKPNEHFYKERESAELSTIDAESSASSNIDVAPATAPESSTSQEIRQETSATHAESSSREIRGDISTENIVQGKRTRKQSRRTMDATLLACMAQEADDKRPFVYELLSEPSSWNQMLKHKYVNQWKEAVREHLRDIKLKGTFYECDITTKEMLTQPIPVKWVFTYRSDAAGRLTGFRARLVVRGDLEKEYPGMPETYAATPPAYAIRAFMALAAMFRWHIRQFDVVLAFLNTMLDDGNSPYPVYIKAPQGCREFGIEGDFLRLRKALFGLDRSPALWRQTWTKILSDIGFQESSEPCIWFRGERQHLVVFLFHVDDVLSGGPDPMALDAAINDITNKIDIKFLDGSKCLGLQICQSDDRSTISICQSSYIEKKANELEIDIKKETRAPLSITKLSIPDENFVPQPRHVHRMRRLIGSELFAAIMTRPDISKSVQLMAQVMTKPTAEHIKYGEQILEYLYTSRDEKMFFRSCDSNAKDCFKYIADAAFADNLGNRSTIGYVFQIAGTAVDWQSKTLSSVVDSTTEAELYAISHAAKQEMWWQRLLHSLPISLHMPTPTIQNDNHMALRALQLPDSRFTTRLKHVDIKRSWIRQQVQENQLNVEYIPTSENLADGLTRIYPANRYEAFRRSLGLRRL